MRKIVFLWIALIAVSMNAFADGKVSFTCLLYTSDAADEL
mgnify:CR=1 FL=1